MRFAARYREQQPVPVRYRLQPHREPHGRSDSEEFKAEILRCADVSCGEGDAQGRSSGCVGARPNAFQTVRYSEKLLDASGINVSTIDLSEVLGNASKIAGRRCACARQVGRDHAYAASGGAPDDRLVLMAKLAIVLTDWMDAYDIDATAFQCWDSLQKNYGINACTVMSMTGEKLMPSACEGEISGDCVNVRIDACGENAPSALVDWNSNYNNEPDKCLFFHCGNWAKSLVSNIEIIPAEVLGTTLGRENTWGAVQGRTPAGPLTFARTH